MLIDKTPSKLLELNNLPSGFHYKERRVSISAVATCKQAYPPATAYEVGGPMDDAEPQPDATRMPPSPTRAPPHPDGDHTSGREAFACASVLHGSSNAALGGPSGSGHAVRVCGAMQPHPVVGSPGVPGLPIVTSAAMPRGTLQDSPIHAPSPGPAHSVLMRSPSPNVAAPFDMPVAPVSGIHSQPAPSHAPCMPSLLVAWPLPAGPAVSTPYLGEDGAWGPHACSSPHHTFSVGPSAPPLQIPAPSAKRDVAHSLATAERLAAHGLASTSAAMRTTPQPRMLAPACTVPTQPASF
jgi:hypothetical protein